MKIYISESTTIDFLTNFTANMYDQLQELTLLTRNISQDNNVYANVTNIITKFRNLDALHLIIPLKYLHTKLLFSKYRKIVDLSILGNAPAPHDDETAKYLKAACEHIREHCTNLKYLEIYRYENAVSVECLEFVSRLLPNVIVKSTQIDLDGKIFLHNRAKHND